MYTRHDGQHRCLAAAFGVCLASEIFGYHKLRNGTIRMAVMRGSGMTEAAEEAERSNRCLVRSALMPSD